MPCFSSVTRHTATARHVGVVAFTADHRKGGDAVFLETASHDIASCAIVSKHGHDLWLAPSYRLPREAVATQRAIFGDSSGGKSRPRSARTARSSSPAVSMKQKKTKIKASAVEEASADVILFVEGGQRQRDKWAAALRTGGIRVI